MHIEHVRIRNQKLLLTAGGRRAGLPAGTYRNTHGKSLTFSNHVITDALTQLKCGERQQGRTRRLHRGPRTATLKHWQSSPTGNHAQLANIDLQNALQKQQQSFRRGQMAGKMLHDTTMAIIRKVG